MNKPDSHPSSGAIANPLLKSDKLSISGMHCSACHQIIEFRLKKLQGVDNFHVNIASHTASVSWNPKSTSLNQIIEEISSLGYGALPIGSAGEAINREHKLNIWRLFVAGLAMMQVMMYALPSYIDPIPQIDGDLTPDIDRLLKLASLAIALPVVIFSAMPFFKAALRDLRNRHIGMDIPVSIGILVTFLASLWATFSGGPVYYDSLIMFVFLLLSARMIQSRVHHKSTAALRVLTQLLPLMADKLTDYPESMRTEQINAAQLNKGDHILIQPGAKIPVDGIVVSGMSECDESLMTGESKAVSKSPGMNLIGGAINLNRPIVVRATEVGDNTQLSTLVRMMESAASERPPLVQLIDRYASVFLSTIVVLAILSGIAWWQLDSSRAIWIAVTVLVITCPCALSLATPGVMSAAIGQLAKNGLLVARGRAIESLARTTHFVFDKTGTLTQGKLKLLNTLIVSHKAHFDEHLIRQLTIDITARSIHPVAQALYTALSNQQSKPPLANQTYFEEINEIPGLGIEAHHQNTLYRLGNLDFVQELHGNKLELPQNWANKSISALGDQNGYIAVFALEDTLRNDAKQLIELLQKRGKEVILLSGDRADVVNQAATELGINKALSNLSPEEKYNEVKALQRQGAIVAMIGDGMNDGPVLSLANVSIAMGQGAPISQARSDMVLISNDLRDLAFAITITSKSLTLIRQNLGWAVIYNAIAIPAAMFGILAPWHAAIGMSLSSIIVVANSLRLYKISNQHRQADNMMASQSSKQQLTTATSP